MSAEEVRRYGRSLTLETTDRHSLARLNPVSLRCQQNLGEFVSSTFSLFEGIWLDTEFSTGTIPEAWTQLPHQVSFRMLPLPTVITGQVPGWPQSSSKRMDPFGVPSFPRSVPSPPGEIARYYHLAPSVEIINSGFVWHSDRETPETISSTGLAAVTRTYAKVIVDTNALDLNDLRTTQMPK